MLVSIITPTLNQGAYIAATIESVLGQNYPHLEYIIIDGGSTDNTLSIIQRYANDPRLQWVSEPDDGMSAALNKGFGRSTGALMGWLNSDDTFTHPHALAQIVAYFAEQPTCDLLYGDAVYLAADGSPLDLPPKGAPFDLVALLSDVTPIPQPGVFWRRGLWARVGHLREDLHFAMDVDYWLRAARLGNIHYLPGVRASYRLQPASKTVSQAEFQWLERLSLCEAACKDFPQLNAPRVRGVLRSNLYLGLAKAYHAKGKRADARRAIRQALRHSPPRLRWFYIALLTLDWWAGTRLAALAASLWRRMPR